MKHTSEGDSGDKCGEWMGVGGTEWREHECECGGREWPEWLQGRMEGRNISLGSLRSRP